MFNSYQFLACLFPSNKVSVFDCCGFVFNINSNSSKMKLRMQRRIFGGSRKCFSCTGFQIKYGLHGISSPWDLIRSQNLHSLTCVYWIGSKALVLSSWLKQAGEERDARYIWFAVTVQRMIHWWCSWSARAYRGTSHLLRLCPITSKPSLLSGITPLWIHLATRGNGGKALAQKRGEKIIEA